MQSSDWERWRSAPIAAEAQAIRNSRDRRPEPADARRGGIEKVSKGEQYGLRQNFDKSTREAMIRGWRTGLRRSAATGQRLQAMARAKDDRAKKIVDDLNARSANARLADDSGHELDRHDQGRDPGNSAAMSFDSHGVIILQLTVASGNRLRCRSDVSWKMRGYWLPSIDRRPRPAAIRSRSAVSKRQGRAPTGKLSATTTPPRRRS